MANYHARAWVQFMSLSLDHIIYIVHHQANNFASIIIWTRTKVLAKALCVTAKKLLKQPKTSLLQRHIFNCPIF